MSYSRTEPSVRFLRFITYDPSGCWLWTGTLDKKGYGGFSIARCKKILAHRFAYEHFREPIPKGLTLDHLCRVHNCVNPDHLEAVTRRENLLRGVGFPAVNARKTHCLRGHEFNDRNTRRARGARVCRICDALLARQRRKKK